MDLGLGATGRYKLKRNNGPGPGTLCNSQRGDRIRRNNNRIKKNVWPTARLGDLNYGDEAPYAIHIIKHDAVFVQM